MKHPAALLLLTILGLTQVSIRAQDPKWQFWTDFTDYLPVDASGVEIGGDGGLRTSLDSRIERVVYLRPTLRYTINSRLRFHVGLGWFEALDSDSAREVRPWIGLSLAGPRIATVPLTSYIRLEKRSLSLGSRNTDLWRARYRLGTRVPLRARSENQLDFIVSGEAFIGFGGDSPASTLQRLRLTTGIGFDLPKKWQLDVVYLLQESRSESVDPFVLSHHIFRLQFKR